jgi:hypothetical protein
MKTHRIVALAVASALAVGTAQTALLAQSGALGGTAKDEAKKPFTEYSVRARDVSKGSIAETTPLSADGAFALGNLPAANYLVELLNKNGKVVCTEGPYDLTKQSGKSDIVIDCNKVPAAWWLLGAAAAAGVTAGVAAGGTASAAQ